MIFIQIVKILGSLDHLLGTKCVLEHPFHPHITTCKMFVYYVIITIFASLFAYKKPRLNFRRVKVYVNINMFVWFCVFFFSAGISLCFVFIYLYILVFFPNLFLSFMSPFLRLLFLFLSLFVCVCLDVWDVCNSIPVDSELRLFTFPRSSLALSLILIWLSCRNMEISAVKPYYELWKYYINANIKRN